MAYLAPDPTFDFEAALKQTKALFGYELFGYQAFFATDEAAGILEKHVRCCYFIATVLRIEILNTLEHPRGIR